MKPHKPPEDSRCEGCGLCLRSNVAACPTGGRCEYVGPTAFAMNAGTEYFAEYVRETEMTFVALGGGGASGVRVRG